MFGGILVVRVVKKREPEGIGPTKTFAGEKKTSLFFYFRIKVLSGRFGEGMELKPAAIVCWRLNVLLPNVHQWLAEVDPWY